MGVWFDEVTPQGSDDVVRSFSLRETPLSEYLGAKVSEGFDYTTTGRFLDERRVRNAEAEAYGPDTRPNVDSGELAFADPEAQINLTRSGRPVMTKEEWNKSEWHRPSIDFEKAGEMTPVRAQLMADDFDKRRYRDSLIERSPTGLRSILGFGAGMIGSLPDPVNLVGFGAVSTGRTLGKAALIGAAENVAATTLTDAIVLPDLAARGEQVGFQEFVMDNMFAAAIGGIFGMGGQALKNAVETARMRAHMTERRVLADSLERAVTDVADGRPADVREVLKLEQDALGRLYDDARLQPEEVNVPRSPEASPPSEVKEISSHRNTVESAVSQFIASASGAAPTRIIRESEIPQRIRDSAARIYGDAPLIHEGWTDHLTGEVVLVADNLTPERAVEVWMHEQIGHHGLRKVFGDASEMGMFLDSVAERYGHTGTNSRVMAEEEVARIAEKMSFGTSITEEERSLWSQLIEAARAWLVRNGLAEVRDEDIHRVLQESLASVRKGEEKPQVKPGVVQFGEPHPEHFTEPKGMIQRAEQSSEMSEAAMAAQVESLRDKGQLRGVDHFELQEAGTATERAERYGEHLLNIAECAAKVVE